MPIDVSKGLLLARLEKSPKTITFFDKEKNSGYQNLEKFPWSLDYIKRITIPAGLWEDMDEFEKWLGDSFSHMPDGIYYLIGWRDSVRRIKWKKKKRKFVRPFEPFAKFEIRGNTVDISERFKRSKRTGRTYVVWLMLKKERSDRDPNKRRGKTFIPAK